MKRYVRVVCGVGLLPALLLGCSPALNWRQVRLEGLHARLPCKPDTATRDVMLGDQRLALQMAGCEADGALFAISHVHVPAVAQRATIQAQWQRQALAAMQAGATTTPPYGPPAWVQQAISLQAQGRNNPQGQPVQARLLWLLHGNDIYHLAVYAPRLSDELTQPLMEDLAAP